MNVGKLKKKNLNLEWSENFGYCGYNRLENFTPKNGESGNNNYFNQLVAEIYEFEQSLYQEGFLKSRIQFLSKPKTEKP